MARVAATIDRHTAAAAAAASSGGGRATRCCHRPTVDEQKSAGAGNGGIGERWGRAVGAAGTWSAGTESARLAVEIGGHCPGGAQARSRAQTRHTAQRWPPSCPARKKPDEEAAAAPPTQPPPAPRCLSAGEARAYGNAQRDDQPGSVAKPPLLHQLHRELGEHRPRHERQHRRRPEAPEGCSSCRRCHPGERLCLLYRLRGRRRPGCEARQAATTLLSREPRAPNGTPAAGGGAPR